MKRHAPHNSFRTTQARTKAAPRKSKKSTVALLAVGLALLVTQTRGGAAPGDALPYERGFLITGNYVVGGVDFTPQQNPADSNGFSTGSIRFNPNPAINNTNPGIDNTVPAGSEIVGAYLYLGGNLHSWRNTDARRRVPREPHRSRGAMGHRPGGQQQP